MNAIHRGQLTPDEARAFLRAVIEREIKRLNVQRTVVNMDKGVGSLDDDERHDWAQKTAWGLLATHGVRAKVTPAMEADFARDGIAPLAIETLRDALSLIARTVTHESGHARRDAMFQSVAHREPSGAMERLRLLELYLHGMAVAQAQPPATVDRDLAEDVLASINPMTLAFEPSNLPAPSIPPGDQSISQAEIAEPMAIADPAEKNAEADATSLFDPEIPAIIERLIETKSNDDGGIEEKTAQAYRAFGTLFIRITGKSDVRDLRQADAALFHATLSKLPKSFGKSPAHRTDPIADVIGRAALLPKEQVGLSVPTRNRYLDQLGAVLRAARAEGIEIDPKIDPSILRRKENVRARDKKRAFKHAELVALFEHPFFQPAPLPKGNLRHFRARQESGLYWVPLICAYTGARREEAAGLSLSEIKREGDVWYLDLTTTTSRRLKTLSSVRKVPLHEDLIKLGFDRFVASAKARKRTLIFPDLREAASPFMGRKVGRFMESLAKEIWGDDGDDLTLNSMRHYFKHTLAMDPGVPSQVCRDLMGHEGTDIHTTVYGEQTPLPMLKAAIDRLPSVICKIG